MQRRVHIFTKLKNKHPWKYKKKIFQLIHLKKILIFHICVSSENAQCLKQPYDKKRQVTQSTIDYSAIFDTVNNELIVQIEYCKCLVLNLWVFL